jgi:hypothetical protein
MVKTVKELKKAIEKLPDDMPIEVYSGQVFLIDFVDVVECDDLNCQECGGNGTCLPPTFTIFAETYKD